MEVTATVRESLRDVIASDAYAATFQTMGQYRNALLQHIRNLDAADRAAQLRSKHHEHED